MEKPQYVSLADYLGNYQNHPDATNDRRDNASNLLKSINALIAEAVLNGVVLAKNPMTQTYISGNQNGGFRPQDCQVGAPKSSHKEGTGADIADRSRALGKWCLKNPEILKKHNIYIEHPEATPNWVHMTNRPPKSGKQIFYP